MEFLTQPLPWYVAGPLIGIVVPFVYLYAGRRWGMSSTFRDICSAWNPGDLDYLRYDWRTEGSWRLAMATGLIVGAAITTLLAAPDVVISERTVADLAALGITDFSGVAPKELFSWSGLLTVPGAILIVVGGFLVGFGTRYAGGCTSGHAITGLANFRLASLVATIGFFVGGLISTHLLLPLVLAGGS